MVTREALESSAYDYVFASLLYEIKGDREMAIKLLCRAYAYYDYLGKDSLRDDCLVELKDMDLSRGEQCLATRHIVEISRSLSLEEECSYLDSRFFTRFTN